MIDVPLANDGDGFKTAMGVGGKTRHGMAVVHAPAIFLRKVMAHLSTLQRGLRRHALIARWVVIDMVNQKQKGVDGGPRG